MKKFVATTLVTAFLIACWSPCFAQKKTENERSVVEVAQEPLIRVLIAKDINAALLEAKGPYAVLREGTHHVLSSGTTGKRFVVQPMDNGLRWGEEYPDDYQIVVVGKEKTTTMYVNGIQYKGDMYIYYNKAGGICIVNEVNVEDFLKSALASEFNAPLSKEAMASYTIAARTNAYGCVEEAKQSKRLWDISGITSKYYGLGVTKQKNGVDEAVDLTKHIVLMKGKTPVLNIALSKDEAEAQSNRGLDAKKILKNICPGSDLSVTVPPNREGVR